jgi:hypothetical protein
MREELNGFEAINTPIGTQFEVIYLDGTTREVEVYKNDEGIFFKYIDADINELSIMDFHRGLDTAKFIMI